MKKSLIERGVALSGSQAKEWLHTRGWDATAQNLHVFADVFDAPRFGYSRTWLAAGQYERIGTEESSRVRALLLVEGSAELGLDHQMSDFGVGDMALVGGASPVVLSTTAPVAIYEIVTDYDRMGLGRYDLPPTSGPHATSPNYWPALAGLINQVLASSVTAEDFGISSVRTAVDNLLLASLKESTAMSARKRLAEENHLLRRARAIIQDEAHSSDLTVARLAELVRVSRAHLHRLFSADNSTPLAEIRAARVELAQLHLAEDNGQQESNLLEVAQRSGFKTASALRRALRRA
ncbi:AraC family transcriptional regulator [Microbacterium sp. W4I20]|uniref:AraC family transcriptional regulator n=1 Tax=Microbacterium sp. W4I20 TaxID=3042262 RepID=UPI00277F8837|nr:AraC family transcriptional regulator [Microbacterium sp. W4I20]MDQ0729174.1 AraC-like DNA-binding protein [Microbacterium sp. W4I20]